MGLFGFNLRDVQNIASGYMESEIKKKQAKGKASAEAAKAWKDAAIGLKTDPDNAKTTANLSILGYTPDMGEAYVEAFNMIHAQNDVEDITEHPLFISIVDIGEKKEFIPTIGKMTLQIKDLKSEADLHAWLTEFTTSYTEPEDGKEPKSLESIRKFLSPNLSLDKIKAVDEYMQKGWIVDGKQLLPPNFTIGDVAKLTPEQQDALDTKLHNVVAAIEDLDSEENKDISLKTYNYGELGDLQLNLKADGHANFFNDAAFQEFVSQDKFWKKAASWEDEQKNQFNAQLSNWAINYGNMLKNKQKTMGMTGTIDEETGYAIPSLTGTKTYMALRNTQYAALINKAVMDNALQDFFDVHGNGAKVEGVSMTAWGDPIVKQVLSEGKEGQGISSTQSLNNDQLATWKGYSNKAEMYNDNPNYLFLDQSYLDFAYDISSSPEFQVVIGEDQVQSIFSGTPVDVANWTATQHAIVVNALNDSFENDIDKMNAWMVLTGKGASHYKPPKPESSQHQVKPLTESQLKKKFDEIYESDNYKELMDGAKKTIASINRGIQVKQDYLNLIKDDEIDVGKLGDLKELWNNLFTAEESILNRLTGNHSIETEVDVMIAQLDHMIELTKKDGIMVDDEARTNMVAQIRQGYAAGKSVFSNDENKSFKYGRKRTMEVFLAYTQARSFDDNGRISDKDYTMNLQSLVGTATSNKSTARGSITYALEQAEAKKAFYMQFVSSSDENKFVREILIGNEYRSFLDPTPLARVSSAVEYSKLFAPSSDTNSLTSIAYQNHDAFETGAFTASFTRFLPKRTNVTYEGVPIYTIYDQDTNSPHLQSIGGLHYTKVNGGDWKKIPWRENSKIKNLNIEDRGSTDDSARPVFEGISIGGDTYDVYGTAKKYFVTKEGVKTPVFLKDKTFSFKGEE